MQLTKKLVDTILKQYSARIHLDLIERGEDCFSFVQKERELYLQAKSDLAAIVASAWLEPFVKSGHLHELIGEKKAKFPLRMLDFDHSITPEQILRYGYNALLVEEEENASLAKEYGLQLFRKVSSLDQVPVDEGIFWTSQYRELSFLKGEDKELFTLIELMVQEMKKIESDASDRPLIFFVPFSESVFASHEKILYALSNEAGCRTTLAFPFMIGGKLHPFLEGERNFGHQIETPLLPFVDSHLIPPLLPGNHNYAGLCLQVPKYGFEEFALWLFGRFLWEGRDPELELNTWIKGYHSEWPTYDSHRLIVECDKLWVDLERAKKGPISDQEGQLLQAKLLYLVEKGRFLELPSLWQAFAEELCVILRVSGVSILPSVTRIGRESAQLQLNL